MDTTSIANGMSKIQQAGDNCPRCVDSKSVHYQSENFRYLRLGQVILGSPEGKCPAGLVSPIIMKIFDKVTLC